MAARSTEMLLKKLLAPLTASCRETELSNTAEMPQIAWMILWFAFSGLKWDLFEWESYPI